MIFLEPKYCWVCGERLFELASMDPTEGKIFRNKRKGVAVNIADEGPCCVIHCEAAEHSRYYWVNIDKLQHESTYNFYQSGKSLRESLRKLSKLKVA